VSYQLFPAELRRASDVVFDDETDVVVVGSGAGAFTAAITAGKHSAEVIQLEKADDIGGTTRKAAAAYWIPNNHFMRARGVEDPRADALRHMARLTRPATYDPAKTHLGLTEWEHAMIEAFYDHAGDAVEPEQVDPELAQARAHLDAGDFDAALTAYQALLDANPNDPEAKGAVRQIGFLQRATAHRPDAIAVADAAPDDIDAAFAAADVDVLQQNVAGAFDRLIALIKRTADDERTKVRTRLIELFDLFDPADPEVIAGRRNLANALY